jgi:hypothetical protein
MVPDAVAIAKPMLRDSVTLSCGMTPSPLMPVAPTGVPDVPSGSPTVMSGEPVR